MTSRIASIAGRLAVALGLHAAPLALLVFLLAPTPGFADSSLVLQGLVSTRLQDGGELKGGYVRLPGIPENPRYAFAVQKFRADGDPDPSFHGGEVLPLPIWGFYEFADSLLEQPDGRILVAGWAADPAYVSEQNCHPSGCGLHPAVARIEADGRLDLSFNRGGKFVGGDLLEEDAGRVTVGMVGDTIVVYTDGGLLGRLEGNGTPEAGFVAYPAVDVQGAWHGTTPTDEGFELALTQQGEILFGTLMFPIAAHEPAWLVFALTRTGPNTYRGDLLETTGPWYELATFDPRQVRVSNVGDITIRFDDDTHGLVTLDFDELASFTIGRSASPSLGCVYGATDDLSTASNYTDFWNVAPLDREPGWALYILHGDDRMQVTWFAYEKTGAPAWMRAELKNDGHGTYSGPLLRDGSPAGWVTIDPEGGNGIYFGYSISPDSRAGLTLGSRRMTRYVYRYPGTVCR